MRTKLPTDLPDYERTVGNQELCAWAVGECECWVQTRNPDMARLIPKKVEARRVGYGVKGGYLAIFAVKRTLPWVQREVVWPIIVQFPRKTA